MCVLTDCKEALRSSTHSVKAGVAALSLMDDGDTHAPAVSFVAGCGDVRADMKGPGAMAGGVRGILQAVQR